MADARKKELPEAPFIQSPVTYRDVDAFYRPAAQPFAVPTRTTMAADLAVAFEGFGKAATPLLEDQRNKVLAKERVAATDEANKAIAAIDKNREGFNKLIRDGAISPGASPHFRDAYYRQVMRVAADTYDQALKTAYESSPVKNSDDPKQMMEFAAKFREQWVKTNLGDGMNALAADEFLPRADRAETILAKEHTQFRTQEIEKSQVEKTQQEITGMFDRARRMGVRDPAVLAQEITALKDRLVTSGARGSTMTKAIVDAVKMRALEENNPSVLKVLDHIKTGTGLLGNTQYAREARYETEKAIAREGERRLRMSLLLQEKQDKIIGRQGQSEAIGRLIDNPHADVTDIARSLAQRGLGDKAKWVLDLSRTLSDRADNPREERVVVSTILNRAMDPEDQTVMEDATREYRAGSINKTTYEKAMTLHKQAYENPTIFNNDDFKKTRQYIEDEISGGAFAASKGDIRIRAGDAGLKFKELYMDWALRNKNASPEERFRKVRELRDLIISDPAYGISKDAQKIRQQEEDRRTQGREDQRDRRTGQLPSEAPTPQFPAPDERAIKFLQENPQLAPQFDAKFGPGSAKKYLKKGE
jgi:hypothetical protein